MRQGECVGVRGGNKRWREIVSGRDGEREGLKERQ